ncbi:HAMP domain-containing histidine kinase [Sphingobium sp. BYY-5]|uniref:sensor histidine kinase n=1 Tax=Sphingobium sp. BYY-5 TaxID=2926400 RepID=UPI001FA749FA|nr:HAMP domain-containing sensor histidine kinase [Sphingobium sp. BYY-5]MCI4589550.1 HAMP domain-containing histidine kinase [Sphingobium sp. BYY-5]
MSKSAHPAILHASLLPNGCLASADAPLLGLQRTAGGDLGTPLAIPQLAAVVRLAQRLGVTVSRPVIAAAEQGDIGMWVRARPEGGGVLLSVIDWHERPAVGALVDEAAREADIAALAEGWIWQIDMQLRFQMILAGDDPQSALPADPPVPGMRFSAYFDLKADDEGDMVMLRGLAQNRAFREQSAALVADPTRLFRLSAFPLFDLTGQLSGYRGTALPFDQVMAPFRSDATVTLYPSEFGKRLDRSLRKPLSRIIATADTISAQLEGPLRPDYADYAQDIASAGRHLMALVDDLADLQAIDRPDFTVAAEDVDLADLGRRAAGLLAVKALDRKINIIVPDAQTTVIAVGEFRRVLQILVNLVNNAVRYAPEGSSVRIVTEQGLHDARIMVIDQGPGIDMADRERIFDKFERLGRNDTSGSGLGLYISRRLARAMGGDIRIGGMPGEGGHFTLSLPGTC